LFGAEAVLVLIALLAWSVLMREPSLFLLVLALLIAAAISRLWELACLTGVEYRRRFASLRVPFGDQIEMEIEVVNRKLLPLSWLEIEDEIPRELQPARGSIRPSHKPGRARLCSLLALRPYERIRRRYSIPCLARGEHLFGPVLLRSGDLFGFATREQLLELEDVLIVYPRIVPLAELGLPARYPLGELRTQSWLFEDTSRVAGAREYRPDDSLRRVHWPASARAQQLQSRVYDATTSHKLAIFLNVDTSESPTWNHGYDPEVLELSITAAASIASWGIQQGYQTGIYTNGMHLNSGTGDVIVEPGRSTDHLEKILLALGRLQPVAGQRFEELLARESPRLPFGSTLVVVTAALLPAIRGEIQAIRARGHAVSVILTGRAEASDRPEGIAVRRVGPPEAWRQMTVLTTAKDNGHAC